MSSVISEEFQKILNKFLTYSFLKKVCFRQLLRGQKGLPSNEIKKNENLWIVFKFPKFKLNVKGGSSICWALNTLIIIVIIDSGAFV